MHWPGNGGKVAGMSALKEERKRMETGRWRGAVVPVLAGIFAAAVAGCAGAPPVGSAGETSEEAGAVEKFDGERALEKAVEFAGMGEKVPGTEESGRIAEWLAGELRGAGAEDVEIRRFAELTPAGEVEFRNVAGRVPGTGGGDGFVAFAAHWDTKTGIEGFVGANDGASGVGAVLEIARAVAEAPLGLEARFVFFDGEECRVSYSSGGVRDGFHGSARLAEEWDASGELRRMAGLFLLDMVGDRDWQLTVPRNCDPELVRRVLAAAREEGVRERCKLLPYAMGDDHVAFAARGGRTVDLIDFEYGSAPGKNDYWHTAEDTVDKLSADSLRTAGRIALRAAAGVCGGAEGGK